MKTNRKMSLPRIPLIKTAGRKNKSAARAFVIKKSSNLRLDFGPEFIFFRLSVCVPRGRALHGVTRIHVMRERHPAFGVKTTRNSRRLRESNRAMFERIRERQIFSQASAPINADIPTRARTARGSGAESRSGRRSRPIGASGQTHVARQFPVRYFRIDSQPLFARCRRARLFRSFSPHARPATLIRTRASLASNFTARARECDRDTRRRITSGAEGAE